MIFPVSMAIMITPCDAKRTTPLLNAEFDHSASRPPDDRLTFFEPCCPRECPHLQPETACIRQRFRRYSYELTIRLLRIENVSLTCYVPTEPRVLARGQRFFMNGMSRAVCRARLSEGEMLSRQFLFLWGIDNGVLLSDNATHLFGAGENHQRSSSFLGAPRLWG
ncbi:MAG: hypothetical protein KatS3mg111_0867 [Pirellulaceae bacterium]|nr:MAG: hypothetical protein KatS3mg111_0867 [Pirellulaceae bacterium]